MNTQNESVEICIDKTANGEPVIYVSPEHCAGTTHTFADLAQACKGLDDLKKIAQVIVPVGSIWERMGFQTELIQRRDRKSEHLQLAQRLARIRAGIKLGARQRYRFEGDDKVKFDLHFADTCQMTVTELKAALKNEDLTLVAAQAKAKAKAEAKAEWRRMEQKAKTKMMDEYQKSQANEKVKVIKTATALGKNEGTRHQVLEALRQMGLVAVPKAEGQPATAKG
jgi:hypothetical protein